MQDTEGLRLALKDVTGLGLRELRIRRQRVRRTSLLTRFPTATTHGPHARIG